MGAIGVFVAGCRSVGVTNIQGNIEAKTFADNGHRAPVRNGASAG
jgi:hypothetical protein